MRSQVGRPLFLILATFITLAIIFVAMLLVGHVRFHILLPFYMAGTLSMAFLYPVLLVLVHDVVPVAVRATAIGIQLTVSQLLGGILGPIFVGIVSDMVGGGGQGIARGLIWTIPVASLSIITTLIMTKYYADDSSKISDVVLAEN
jgi:MFS family permease